MTTPTIYRIHEASISMTGRKSSIMFRCPDGALISFSGLVANPPGDQSEKELRQTALGKAKEHLQGLLAEFEAHSAAV